MRRWLLFGVLVAGCAGSGDGPARVEVGLEAPSYAARNLEGDSVSLALLRGKPVLLNVWATWCLPCKEEIPYLETLHGKHAAQGLQIIGVSIDARGDEPKIASFARDFRMSYPIWRDPDERVNSRFLAIGVPSTYLIDRDGVLRWKHLGTLRPSSAGFQAALDEVLREKGGTQ
jgi:thiol-disulfide isomerase/thioredoxin